MLYDGLKKSFPESEVFAFPKGKKTHMFQTDAVCRIDGFRRGDVVEYAQKLHNNLLSVEISEVNNLIDMHFPSGAQGTLTFGIPNVLAKDVNKATTTEERQLLRESLGGSEELYMQFLDDTPMRGADMAHQHFRVQFDDVIVPSRVYFMVLAVEAVALQGAQYDVDIRSCIQHNIGSGLDHMEKVIINPFCPGENLHSDPAVRNFLRNFCEAGVPIGYSFEEYVALRREAKAQGLILPD